MKTFLTLLFTVVIASSLRAEETKPDPAPSQPAAAATPTPAPTAVYDMLASQIHRMGFEPSAMPAVEIVPSGELYDFSARVTPGEAEFFAPARITPEAAKAASEVACAVHNALGCRDVSRVDMMLDAEGNPFVLECNSSPGMTETSLLPMAAEAADMTFQDVVSRLIEAALSRGDSGK